VFEGIGVRVGTFGTQRDSPTRIKVELPLQFANWSCETETP
jgi:hypothetical protein